jgi:hypothetical protein
VREMQPDLVVATRQKVDFEFGADRRRDNVLNLVTAGFPRGETAGVGAPVFDRPVERPGGGPDASLRQRPIEFPDVAGAERGFERRARSSWSPSTITPLTSRSRRWTGSAEMPRRRSASGTVVPDAR